MGLRETSSMAKELKFEYPKDEDLSPLFNKKKKEVVPQMAPPKPRPHPKVQIDRIKLSQVLGNEL